MRTAGPACEYRVVHPLDDVPEAKRSGADLGLMRLTPGVRLTLIALRLYLIFMLGLVFWRVIELSGTLVHHVRP